MRHPPRRNRWSTTEGLGYDHRWSSACGILGIGSTSLNNRSLSKMTQTEFWTAGKRIKFCDSVQDALSEEKRCFIERRIEKWRKKYPEANLFQPPPDDIDRMIAITTGCPLPHAPPLPMPTANVGHRNFLPHALATQGTVAQRAHYQPVSKTSSVRTRHCQLMNNFNGQGNERAAVSGRKVNPFGAIGTPLPPRK